MSNNSSTDRAIRRRVVLGTASNFVGQLFVFLISFLLTPYILQNLGASEYGLWILVGSIVAYTSLMDFGLWGAVIKHVAEFKAHDDIEGAQTLLSTVLYAYIGIAALIALVGVACAPFLPRLFDLSADQTDLAEKLIILMTLGTALAVPCMLPLAILRGLQRYDVVNGIDILTTLFTAIASVLVLWLGAGATGLAMINIVAVFFMLFTGIWALRRIAPEMSIHWRGANWQMARKVFGYSWPLFTRDVAGRLQSKTDEITIGIFMPVSAVGSYSIARRLSESTQTLTRQFMKTLLPLASQLHSQDDFHRLRGLYKRTGTRLTIAISFILSAILIVLAAPVLTLWVGEQYATYAGLVVVLTIANAIATIQWPATAILQAVSRHRILALSSMGNGIANLLLSILLIRPFGLMGVAVGTAIPIAIEYFFVVLPYSLKVTGVSPISAAREIFLPALLPGIPAFAVLYLLNRAYSPSTLFSLVFISLAGSVVYAAGYLAMGANRSERQWLLEALSSGYHLVTARKTHIDV